jgi:hypothetical protein
VVLVLQPSRGRYRWVSEAGHVGDWRGDRALAYSLPARASSIIPFIPLRTASETDLEESVAYVALYQRPERISLLFTFDV